MSHPKTDIVIPVHNALEYLRNCVETICNYTKDYRIIFVDDFSNAETKAYMQRALSDHPDWSLVQTAKQKWFSRASNLGLRLVKTPLAVLINSDCGVGSGWLQELHDVYNDVRITYHSVTIGIVGSVVYDDKPEAPRWQLFKGDGITNGDYVSGHCYLLNMQAMERLAFDRGTPGWYFNERDPSQIHIASDRIMCWDMTRAGFAVIGCYKSHVGHHGGKSWGHALHTIPRRVEDVD